MGAFGAALIARERYSAGTETTMLSIDKINELKYTTTMANCKGCTNNCRLTINKFSGGRQFISETVVNVGLEKRKIKKESQIFMNTNTKSSFLMNRLPKIRQSEEKSEFLVF